MKRRAAVQQVWRVGWLAVALSAVVPSTALAWKYHEHYRIGSESYRRACARLESELQGRLTRAKESKLADEQLRIDRALVLTHELVCKSVDTMATSYGQATALSGDHIGDPKLFLEINGQRDTVSIISYARRALGDGDHYHPRSPIKWQDYHILAINLAKQAVQRLNTFKPAGIDETLRRAFVDVFYVNAFGDHFLQDSFAAGHMGFNRGSSRPVASMLYHDKYNRRGRAVRNRLYARQGEIGPAPEYARNEWRTHGDGALHWKNKPREESGRDQVLLAATLSIYDTLWTFVYGSSEAKNQQAIRDNIPFAYFDENVRSWIPLANMHNPANVTSTASVEYRHVVGTHGLDRDQLAAAVSFPLIAQFGLRLDVAAGLIIPPIITKESTWVFHSRAGLTIPVLADYGSALSLDLAAGTWWDVCMRDCYRSKDSNVLPHARGFGGGYLGPHLNIEGGKLFLIQLFGEGFIGADFRGRFVPGLSFGVSIGKGFSTQETGEFAGPLL